MSDSPGRREVAHRLFAAEYDGADFEYSESDEERAPNYVVTPTGARVNRLFVVGVLTEVESVGEGVLRARVVDPTGAFVVYAGQYQPEAMAFLEDAQPPMFVAVTGKARTFSPDDADVVYTSVRPESVNEVDAEARDRWTLRAATHTLGRVAAFDAALETGLTGDDLSAALDAAGVPGSHAAGIPVALDHYGTTEHYLASMAGLGVDALRLVAGELDELDVPDLAPDARGDGTVDRERLAALTDLVTVDLDLDAADAGGEATADEPVGSAEPDGADADGETDDGETDDGETDDGETVATATAGASESAAAGADSGGDADEFDAGADDSTDEVGEFDADDEVGEFEDSDDVSDSDADDEVGEFDDGGDVGDFDSDDGAEADAAEDEIGEFDAGEDDVGEFDTDDGTTTDGAVAAESDDAPATDEVPDEVLDEEERERVKEEFGTDFQTGTEVEEPGEADIEPEAGPLDPEEMAEADDEVGEFHAGEAASEADAAAESEPEPAETEESAPSEPEPEADEPEPESADDAEPADDSAPEPEEATDDTLAEDVDLSAAVLETMEQLDDGTGADREELISTVVDAHGVAESDVEDAIEDALMGGQCYEPDDGKLSAI